MENKKDFGLGMFSIVLGASVVIYTGQMRSGPAFFPRLVGVIIIILGVIIAAQSGLKIKKMRKEETDIAGSTKNPQVKPTFPWRVIAITACLFAYYFLFQVVGYTIPTFLMIFATAVILGYRNWKVLIPTGLITSVGLYYAFTSIFHINFPGIFF